MDRYDQIIEEWLGYSFCDRRTLLGIQAFLNTGERSVIERLLERGVGVGFGLGMDLAGKLPSPTALSEKDERVIQVLSIVSTDSVGQWLDKHLQKETSNENLALLVADILAQVGFGRDEMNQVIRYVGYLRNDLRVTSAGRWALSFSDDELRTVVWSVWPIRMNVMLVTLFAEECPDRLVPYVWDIIYREPDHADIGLADVLLSASHPKLEQEVYQAFRKEKAAYTKFQLGACLTKHNARYLDETANCARSALVEHFIDSAHTHMCDWMMETFGVKVVPEIADYVQRAHASSVWDANARQGVINDSVNRLGKDALPIILACVQAPEPESRLAAVTQLVSLDDGPHGEVILQAIEQGLAEDATDSVIRYIGLAARWNAEAVSDTLWKLATGKSRPVRATAAKALSTAGAAVLPRALAMLKDRKADNRISAVVVIASSGDAEALQALENAVESEENDDVREEMLAALQDSWQATGRKLPLDFVERRAERVAESGWRAPLWMSKVTFPQIAYSDGRSAPPSTALYVLMRQQKLAEIRSPIELLSFYEQVDRNTTTDFALAVLQGFVGSGADAKDKWALAVAALLGDDRIVPILHTQIRKWAEEGRGKLAEYAVQALALLASDRALLALDSISMRFRTKNKNVGTAAIQAFADAAESLGVSVDELGDRVVPDLGFGCSRSRVIDCGGKQVEVMLGLDFKLSYVDLQKNKTIKSLPSGTPDLLKSELKDLGALLREVAKSQARRLESLMVQQRRWRTDEWRELFLRRPMMIPFGVRLVWAEYEYGEIIRTFRPLEDGTLVSQSSDIIQVDDTNKIGLVHPLELDEPAWLRWKDHLDNYQVTPPFPQLDRAVVIADEERAYSVFCTDFDDHEMNGMTFKGRAERLGWRRGSVCDAGMITAYVKSYPAAGVDAFVDIQDMYVGMDVYSDIKTGKAFFVRQGSVKIGSYEYDEPDSDKDPRLIPFGKVPRIVYSETIGDLQSITRASPEETQE